MDIIVNESFAREWFLEQLRLYPQLPVIHLSQKDYALAVDNRGVDADAFMESAYYPMAVYQSQLQLLHGGTRFALGKLELLLLDILKQAGKLVIT